MKKKLDASVENENTSVMVRSTIYVAEDIRDEMKYFCVKHKMTLSNLMVESFKHYKKFIESKE